MYNNWLMISAAGLALVLPAVALDRDDETGRIHGAVMQADHSGDKAMYGSNVSRREILDGKVAVPKSAHRLVENLAGYSARG